MLWQSGSMSVGGKRLLLYFLLGSTCLAQRAIVDQYAFNPRLLDEGFIAACFEELADADIDGNLGLKSDEYVEFVRMRSGGLIDVPLYQDLPLSLISSYVFTACQCSFLGRGSNCCVGNNAVIDLDSQSSQFIEQSLLNFCVQVDRAIVEEVGPLPTKPPNPSPTRNPTKQPSSAPSMSPSNVPSEIPSSTPSASPTTMASLEPSIAPSVETPMPTFEALSCVRFQYGIINPVPITADEIFNEVNNTLKTGLLIATRNITISTLNTTYPRTDPPGRRLRQGYYRRLLSDDIKRLNSISGPDGYESRDDLDIWDDSDIRVIIDYKMRNWNREENGIQRDLVYLATEDDLLSSGGSRRLVFYTDDFPAVIDNVFDNPFCQKPTPESSCAVVSTRVCVVLEEGDNEMEVRAAILDGFDEAARNGDFEAAVPPEHRVPPE